jgi:hypothetical protein
MRRFAALIVLASFCSFFSLAQAEAPGAPVPAFDTELAQYHKLFSSAALMLVNETHQRIAKKEM